MVPDIGLQPFSHTCYSVLSSILGHNSEWVLVVGFVGVFFFLSQQPMLLLLTHTLKPLQQQ